MKTDDEIKRDVEEELRWDPDIDATNIAVTAKDGVVTLAGFIPSYLQKFEVEKDVKRVQGGVGVANDLEVRLPSIDQRPDPDIARDAVQALQSQLPYSCQNFKVVVRDGWITLDGEAEWNYQKEKAEISVRSVKGAKGVINAIKIAPKVAAQEIKRKIEAAFLRSAEVDAHRIQVEASDGEVVLKGTVHSWFEREQAERAAWQAPGVRKVEDRIVIQP
ncbi:BON domain-containing protein [uncultured Massilia sp.]|uniref:BON domain-containing protein n=1 Tax=uncultured Massilia sp. TaxID=169973 RepID=UPI0025E2ED78|nr:BON domain-containing protein [uncultured Massilia sp.]